jgi:hypothetical protein
MNALAIGFGIVGTCAGVFGLLAAVVQTRRLKSAEHRQKLLMWKTFRTITKLIVFLENSKAEKDKEIDPHVYGAHGLSMEAYRDLLSELVFLERNFTPATLLRWYQVGKLASEWEAQQACQFLETEQIDINSPDVRRLAQIIGRELVGETKERPPDFMSQSPTDSDFR